MLEAAFWGFVGGLALVVGAVIGLSAHASQRIIALVMGFGGGVLISALAFELTSEAYEQGGADAVAFGLVAGAATFFAGDVLLALAFDAVAFAGAALVVVAAFFAVVFGTFFAPET